LDPESEPIPDPEPVPYPELVPEPDLEPLFSSNDLRIFVLPEPIPNPEPVSDPESVSYSYFVSTLVEPHPDGADPSSGKK
jgi:hypothetical protein